MCLLDFQLISQSTAEIQVRLLPQCSWASLLKGDNQFLVHIHLFEPDFCQQPYKQPYCLKFSPNFSSKHQENMPPFNIAKLGYAGVYLLFFLIFAPKHRLWVLVRIVPTIYVFSKNKKNVKIFYMKFSIFACEKFSV